MVNDVDGPEALASGSGSLSLRVRVSCRAGVLCISRSCGVLCINQGLRGGGRGGLVTARVCLF